MKANQWRQAVVEREAWAWAGGSQLAEAAGQAAAILCAARNLALAS